MNGPEYLLSLEYFEKVYRDLFVDYFGNLVEAFQPEGRSWKECLDLYKNMEDDTP
jgi:hypothetical protein